MRPFLIITILSAIAWPCQAELVDPPGKAEPKQFASRGQLLYQNHCTVCHESNVHIRKKRKARNIADIHQWVSKWATHRKLEWSAEEINDVVNFVNQKYYHYSK